MGIVSKKNSEKTKKSKKIPANQHTGVSSVSNNSDSKAHYDIDGVSYDHESGVIVSSSKVAAAPSVTSKTPKIRPYSKQESETKHAQKKAQESEPS